MPESLVAYIADVLPSVLNPSVVEQKQLQLQGMLEKLLLHVPTNQDTQNSEYYSAQYRARYESEQEHTALMSWMVGKAFYSVSTLSSTLDRHLFWAPAPPVGNQCFIYRALLFSLTGLGNCSYRAAFAALELFNILTLIRPDIHVKLQSWPEIDQFVVWIGSDKSQWKIYDPLTNPELIFDLDEYSEKVKPLFKTVGRQKQLFELTLHPNIVKQFLKQLAKMPALWESSKDKIAPQSLLGKLEYEFFLCSRGIESEKEEKTKTAYDQLCQKLNDTLGIKNEMQATYLFP